MQKAINQVGLEFILEWIRDTFKLKDEFALTTLITSTSTDDEVATAKAVFEFVLAQIGAAQHLTKEIVNTLPTSGESNVIYLIPVPPIPPATDVTSYDMWAWIGGEWFSMGRDEIDLTGYWNDQNLTFLTSTEIQDIIDDVMA